jgi:hypothetical protein
MEPSALAKMLSGMLSTDLIPAVVQLVRGLQQVFKQQYHEGLYEVLEYDAVLELLDAQGKTAVFKKRQRVKFVQDHVIAFQDYAWGDGDILVDYQCSPGREVDRYREGNRWNVLISLRESKSSGDVEDFYIERKVKRGFTKSDEWWQAEMQNLTRSLKFSVLFPAQRHCRRAVLVERIRNRATPLDQTHFAELPDGRQVVTWEAHKPKRFETYTLQWRW